MQSDRPAPGPRSDDQRRIRYNHLVERLRNRQVTMEEATELFGLMQGMLRASEAARVALAAAAASGGTQPPSSPAHPKSGVAAPIPQADDLIVAGILAMGAGAGLLAAITKRMTEGAPAGTPLRPGRPETRSTSR